MLDQDLVEIGGLLHNRWSESMDRLDQVKTERNDGSPDWDEFHADRLAGAIKEEQKWREMKQRFVDEHRATLNKAFGL